MRDRSAAERAHRCLRRAVFDLGRGAHDFASHKLALALASGAPSKAEDKLLADVVGVCATFPLKHKWKQEGKDACLIVEPITIKPNGEAIGPYRWAVVYNATAASGPLVCYFDCWLDELGRPTQERGLLTMVAGGALALKFGRILAF